MGYRSIIVATIIALLLIPSILGWISIYTFNSTSEFRKERNKGSKVTTISCMNAIFSQMISFTVADIWLDDYTQNISQKLISHGSNQK